MIVPPYAIFDLETTSLKHDEARILELGLLVVDDNRLEFCESKLVHQTEEVSSLITGITGITTEMVWSKEAEPLSDVLDWMYEKVGTRMPLLGHNILRYDIPVLRNECKRIRHKLGAALYDARLIDTAAIFKAWRLNIVPQVGENHFNFCNRILNIRITGLKYSLSVCCEVLGVDTSDLGPAHRASADVMMTHRVWRGLQEAYYADSQV